MERILSFEEYQMLRKEVGWSSTPRDITEIGLSHTLYSLVVLTKEQVVGCGRVIGDQGLYFYLQDIIVLPEHQNQGLGKEIMLRVMNYIKKNTSPEAFVALMAAQGMAGFYQRFGFEKRLENSPGMYLTQRESLERKP